MLKLKLLAGAVVLAVGATGATGVPAAAQVGSSYYNQHPQTRIEQLRQRLERDIQSRRISQREGYTLRQELRTLWQLERRYAAGGLSRFERDQLNQRIWNLEQRMHYASRGRYYGDQAYDDRRGRGYDDYQRGYDDRYNRDDEEDYREGQWDERSGDWNDRDWEADRPDDYGWGERDERYEPNPRSNDNRGYGTREGTYPVPEQFRHLYRDTNRYYYRYRDGYVYQIDRTTHRTLNTVWVGR